MGSKNFLCEGYSCILSKEFESTKELEAVAKFDQNIFLILLQLDALVVGENMLLVKRSFSNLDLLHPVLRARQSWQILFNARTVQLASWGWPWGRLSVGGGTKYESSNPRWILMSFQHISMGENDFLNLVVILTLHICIEILRFWAFFPYLATTWDDDRSTFSLHEISLDYV